MLRKSIVRLLLPVIALAALLCSAGTSLAQPRVGVYFGAGTGYPYYGSGRYAGYPGFYPYGTYFPPYVYSPGYYPRSYGYYPYNPYGPYYGYVPGNYSYTPNYSSALPYYYGGSFSQPEATAPMPQALLDSDVLFRVRVPANATVWINGDKTTQTGSAREYTSSGLTPGKNYTYEFRAQWLENGKEVESTRKIKVQGGERRHIEFKSGS